MTNLERIMESDRLKHAISSIKTYMSYPNGKLCPTAEIAIEALEKQIPKKPIKSDTEIRYCEVWKCPSCGFEWSTRVVDFCYKCGQAIDWREED